MNYTKRYKHYSDHPSQVGVHGKSRSKRINRRQHRRWERSALWSLLRGVRVRIVV